MTNNRELVALAEEKRDDLKRQVLKWMDDEAAEFRLRFNNQAPMWADYERAEDELEALRATTPTSEGV